MALSGTMVTVLVVLLLAAVYAVIARLTEVHIVDGEGDPLNEPPWWPPEWPPLAPGRYETRVHGSHVCQTSDTYWTGERWIYTDTSAPAECYHQNLDWRLVSA